MVSKLESEVLKMLERIQLNNMQLMRIKSHPVKVKTEEKFIIVDDLENG